MHHTKNSSVLYDALFTNNIPLNFRSIGKQLLVKQYFYVRT